MKTMKAGMRVGLAVMLVGLFFLGLMSLLLLCIYFVCGAVYVFSDAEYTGDIAFIPKWVFLLSIFTFLPGFLGKIKHRRNKQYHRPC